MTSVGRHAHKGPRQDEHGEPFGGAGTVVVDRGASGPTRRAPGPGRGRCQRGIGKGVPSLWALRFETEAPDTCPVHDGAVRPVSGISVFETLDDLGDGAMSLTPVSSLVFSGPGRRSCRSERAYAHASPPRPSG